MDGTHSFAGQKRGLGHEPDLCRAACFGNWPEVGIFAQRAKDRPNRLGVTVCRILEVKDSTVRVAGLDAIDGTPVVDIKPWMVEFGPRGDISQPSWSTELMQGYW